MFGSFEGRLKSEISSKFLSDERVRGLFAGRRKGEAARLSVSKQGAVFWVGKRCVDLGEVGERMVRYVNQMADHARALGVVAPSSGSGVEKGAFREALTDAAGSGKIVAGLDFASEGIFLARCAIRTNAGGRSVAIDRRLGFAGGALSLVLSGASVAGGVKDRIRAAEIGDGEGVRRSQVRTAVGLISMGNAVFYFLDKFAKALWSNGAVLGVQVFQRGADFCFGAGSILGTVLSALGIYRCRLFAEDLNGYLERNASEEERVKGALRFLRSCCFVSDEERADLRAKHGEGEEYKAALKNFAEVKILQFKRRTSMRSAEQVVENVDRLLANFNLDEAKKIIGIVQKDNRMKTVLFAIGMLSSLLCVAGLMLGLFSGFATLPTILYIVSSSIGIGTVLADAFSSLGRGGSDMPDSGVPLIVRQAQ